MTTTARAQTEAALQAVQDELDQIDERRQELETARDGLRAALSALQSSDDGQTTPPSPRPPTRRAGKKSTARKSSRSTAKKASKKSTAKKSTAKKASSSSSRSGAPAVTADKLVAAVKELGGQADTDALKQHLGVDNGRVLTGARTHATRLGKITTDSNGTVRLAEQG